MQISLPIYFYFFFLRKTISNPHLLQYDFDSIRIFVREVCTLSNMLLTVNKRPYLSTASLASLISFSQGGKLTAHPLLIAVFTVSIPALSKSGSNTIFFPNASIILHCVVFGVFPASATPPTCSASN